MKKYNCPSCAAEIEFTANISVYAVCKYCSSIVVRHDVDVQSIGVMAALPEDASPFQIGTQGIYAKVNFTLIGRVKMGWKDGSWNEWFFATDSGKRGWLAEAQGFYAISFEMEPVEVKKLQKNIKSFTAGNDKNLPDTRAKKSKIAPNELLELYKIKYQLADRKNARCIGSEGELPLHIEPGLEAISMDFVGANAEFACIELHGDSTRVFTGHYVQWNDLKCTNYRQFDWPAKTRPR